LMMLSTVFSLPTLPFLFLNLKCLAKFLIHVVDFLVQVLNWLPYFIDLLESSLKTFEFFVWYFNCSSMLGFGYWGILSF
jgi:hypothetical protein